MSIRSAFKGALPADLVTAGVVASAARVSFGRRRPGVPKDEEIWVEELGGEPGAEFGFQRVTRYGYLFHAFVLGNDGPKQDGSAKVDAIELKLETIRDRYHAKCPAAFKSVIPGLIHAESVVEEIDFDDEERRYLEGTVRLTLTVAE